MYTACWAACCLLLQKFIAQATANLEHRFAHQRLSSRRVFVTGMQARIQSLQVTLASDSSQHASAYSQLQQQHEHLQHERESATQKGDHPIALFC